MYPLCMHTYIIHVRARERESARAKERECMCVCVFDRVGCVQVSTVLLLRALTRYNPE